MRILNLMVLTALINGTFLTGCAPSRARMRFSPDTSAQNVDLSWSLVAAIPLDSPLEVDLEPGGRIRGRFRSADGQTLLLEQDGVIGSVPRAEIRRVVINRGNHAGDGALWGLGIGAATGLVVGVSSRCCGDSVVLPVTLLLSGVGSGFGALFGVFFNDRTVIYETPVSGTTN